MNAPSRWWLVIWRSRADADAQPEVGYPAADATKHRRWHITSVRPGKRNGWRHAPGCALVTAKPGSDVTPDPLREHGRVPLARYKVPRDVYLIRESDLPLTCPGKLHRRELVHEAVVRFEQTRTETAFRRPVARL